MKKIFTLAAAAMLAACASAQALVTLDLTAPANPEEVTYTDDGAWTETYSDDFPYIEFTPFMFSHVLGGSWGGLYWDGFTIVRSGDTTNWYAEGESWLAHQWYSIAGGGVKMQDGNIVAADGIAEADADAPFLLGYYGTDYDGAYYDACEVMFNTGAEYNAVGVYVTNNTWAYYSFFDGDGFARAFDQEGDFLKLIATGYDAADEETGTAEFVLASYNNGVLSAIDKWTWFDLTPLGTVSKIVFTMDSSDKSVWGINTAKYFCLDKMQVTEPGTVAVSDVDSDKAVDTTTYVNIAGQQSQQPFEGINVVVTRYTDGTTSTTRVLR